MKSIKKVGSALLALALCLGTFSGCSGTGAASSQPAAASSASQSAAASGTTSTAGTAGSGNSIKIGVITYMSSTRAATMGFFQIGWETAANEINAKGGIDGKKVEFVLGDPANDASLVPQRLTDMKSKGCVAAIFAAGDDLAPAAVEWANTNKFPIALESNTSTEITLKHYSKYAFNCGLNAWSFAKILAKAAVGDAKKKNFVFCGTDGAATIDAEKLLLLEGKKIDPSFSELNSYRVSSDDSQFSNIISTIASSKPDMVLQQGGGPTFVAFAKQGLMFNLFKVSDIYNDFVTDTSTNSGLAASGNFPYGNTHGVFLLPFWDNSKMDTAMQAFCKDYMDSQISKQNKYSAPSDAGLSCYRCAESIILGVQNCIKDGKDYKDSEVLTSAISSVNWSDSTGKHVFRPLDNQLTFDVYYGTSTKDGSEAYGGCPVAKDIKTYTADQVLPTEDEMKSYAKTLGVTGRFN